MNTLVTRSFLTLLALCLLFPNAAVLAAEEDEANLQAVLEMFRSDLNTAKVEIINQVMQLSSEEAEAFWPIYREYENELAAYSDRKVALIREILTHHVNGTLNDENSDQLAKKWFALLDERVKLWKKYHKTISKKVSPMRAVQFLQVEHQIALLIDINIASEMPVIGDPI